VQTAKPKDDEPAGSPAVVNAIRDKDARKGIKEAYGRITALQNDVSLVMWHRPVRFADSRCRIDVFGSRDSAFSMARSLSGARNLPLRRLGGTHFKRREHCWQVTQLLNCREIWEYSCAD
jgi:hypothetical protein